MPDDSYLDQKYFIDEKVYNCPFCNRNNVSYRVKEFFDFDWNENKKCYGVLVTCQSCLHDSLHLSFDQIASWIPISSGMSTRNFISNIDIDSKIFFSMPTSFFVIDDRIPRIIRELITESEGCLKMNFLTGASACMRKAIYELLILQEAKGEHYEERIKSLKIKHPTIDSELFDILSAIQQMTSDKIHEESWDKWDSQKLKLIIETLKAILHEIYVLPNEKTLRSKHIYQLREKLSKK